MAACVDGLDVSRGLSIWQALPLSPLRLQWSADGETLYIESTQGSQYGVYEWHNGHLSLVQVSQAGFSSHWVWLPDGSGAAYADAVTSGDTVRADMFLWQNGEKQQLTNSPFDKYPAAWSPDGTQLAYYLQVSDRLVICGFWT